MLGRRCSTGRAAGRLTAAGEVFLPHAGQAMIAIRRGIESVTAETPAHRSGSARCRPSRRGSCRRPSALTRGAAPRLRLVTGENRAARAVALGRLDLVVGRLAEPERMTGFFFEHLYSEQVVFVVRPGHPLLLRGATSSRASAVPDADAAARVDHPPVRRALPDDPRHARRRLSSRRSPTASAAPSCGRARRSG